MLKYIAGGNTSLSLPGPNHLTNFNAKMQDFKRVSDLNYK